MRTIKIFGLMVFIFIASISVPLLSPAVVSAQTQGVCAQENPTFLSFPTWYKYLEFEEATDGSCDLSVTVPDDAGKIVLAVFEILLRIAGIIAVVMIIYGGVMYVLSQGEPDKTKTAKNTIINALIGLVIALSSVAIVNIIARNIV